MNMQTWYTINFRNEERFQTKTKCILVEVIHNLTIYRNGVYFSYFKNHQLKKAFKIFQQKQIKPNNDICTIITLKIEEKKMQERTVMF